MASPTIVLSNGKIYTLDASNPQVQALVIRNGRVLAIGTEQEVRAAAGPHFDLIDLQGRAAIPGLTDAHVHLIYHALARRSVRLDGETSFDAALQKIALAARSGAGWLQGGGWDHSLWGGRWPTAADLDAIVPDRPVLLSRKDGHAAWLNSMALRIAGIDASTPDPAGGNIRRENGQPTGILYETAIDVARQHIPDASVEERMSALAEAFTEAHSYGMVGMHLAASMRPGDSTMHLRDLQMLREAGKMPLRILLYLSLDVLDEALALGIRSGLGDRWLRIGGVKMFSDGSLGSETAEMLAPYETGSGTGIATLSLEELNTSVRKAITGGLAVMVHAIGDAANRKVLDAIAAAIDIGDSESLVANDLVTPYESGWATGRIPNRIEHCQIVHPDDVSRFAELGVIASMQPIHCTADMDMADRLWGKRSAHAYAWRSLKEAGAILAFGSDAPVESLNPWLSIHAAVTRQRPGGYPEGGWYPEQRLSVGEALLGFTKGCALAAGAAHEQGSLLPGMLADIAVLSDDPFSMNPENLHSVKSELTILEGQVVYEGVRR